MSSVTEARRAAVRPSQSGFDVRRIRQDFPILRQEVRGKPLVYLDNAATTQKPQVVLDTLMRYYTEENANINRAVHLLSERATQAHADARVKVQKFVNAAESQGDRLHPQLNRGHQPRGADLRTAACSCWR